MEPDCSLTSHLHVCGGAQQAHIVVGGVGVEAGVVDDLLRSVMFPQRAVCDADCVGHHQPVCNFKQLIPAETAALMKNSWSELRIQYNNFYSTLAQQTTIKLHRSQTRHCTQYVKLIKLNY